MPEIKRPNIDFAPLAVLKLSVTNFGLPKGSGQNWSVEPWEIRKMIMETKVSDAKLENKESVPGAQWQPTLEKELGTKGNPLGIPIRPMGQAMGVMQTKELW